MGAKRGKGERGNTKGESGERREGKMRGIWGGTNERKGRGQIAKSLSLRVRKGHPF